MKTDFFRYGLLVRSVSLIKHLQDYSITAAQLKQSYPSWSGVPIELILELTIEASWIRQDNNTLLIPTKKGERLLQIHDDTSRLRAQIEDIIRIYEPAWVKLAIYGVSRVVNYIKRDTHQCLREAGLLKIDDWNVVQWWDRIVNIIRTTQGNRLAEIGRKGELLSILVETERTKQDPIWIAVQNNLAGYDIQSVVSSSSAQKLLIEVKTSIKTWEMAECIISRNEWDVLSQADNACLHLWHLGSKDENLHTNVNISTLQEHVPTDNNAGAWKKVSIPFKALCASPLKYRKDKLIK